MYLDVRDRRPPITPQLALRVAIIGGVALALFAIIFFRLWYLQVLSGDKYLAEANDNRVREIKVAGAARRDRRPQRRGAGREPRAMAVKIAPDELPPEGQRGAGAGCYTNLSGVLGLDRGARSAERVNEQFKLLPFSAATVKQDVKLPGRSSTSSSTRTRFPGVTVEQVFLRSYPDDGDRRAPVRHRRRGHRGAARQQATTRT